MSFNRVMLNKEHERNRLRQQFLSEPKQPMSNRRFVGTFFALLLGLSTVYASVFYAPAFFNVGQVLGYSTETVKLPVMDANAKAGPLSSYVNMFKIRRGFIRSGQHLQVNYSLSPGTKMKIHVRRCSAPIFVEVIYCSDAEGQDFSIDGTGPSSHSLLIRQPGFYHFDETVTNLDGSPTKKPFRVVWRRK